MTETANTSLPAPAASSGYRAAVLAMLLLVYTFNFVDRQILGILAPAIKADLSLSDSQLGMLGGLAFALLYSTLAIPLAWLADRTSRSWVITVSLGVWSAFTALCGLAGSFGQLFLARVGVGVGEAGGVAPSYALITDYFRPSSRARALAVYSLGIPLGSAAGVMLGGYLASAIDWRTAFLAVGIAGLAIAPLFRLVVREPRRAAAPADAVPIARVFGILAAKRSFWLLSFGAASSSMCGYGLAFWLPSLLKRSFALDLVATGKFYGALLLIGGVAGVMLGGVLGDRLGARAKGAYAKAPAISFFIAVPLFAAGILSHTTTAAFLFLLIPQALAYVWLAPVITAVQHLVPAHMRATASATFLLINNLIGLGAGTWVMGALSDGFTARFAEDALRYAMLSGLVFYLLAGLLMWLGSRTLAEDWVD
ncbi:MFS transporter [Sphingomonas sp. EC-HK361]|uniref:spinster family MFS transporter n=1 Tax=Sphingomonas sp. EC-HK361 TaxID=2038397 RepID=UPI0012555FE7|nr:MFS transporter [Sphingomonas sp. EC-HK361]